MLGIPEQLVYHEYTFFITYLTFWCIDKVTILFHKFTAIFYKGTHPLTPYVYLETEILLIDRFLVFGYLEKSNLY